MSPPINDAALVCGILGTLLAVLPQIIPQMGLAYRPFGRERVSGMCASGQLPLWVVALVHFSGFTMFWTGQLVSSLQSNRQDTRDHKVVVGLMVSAWVFYMVAHALLHWMLVHQHKTQKTYNKTQVPDAIWFEKWNEARVYLRTRSIPALFLVALSMVFVLFFATAAHTSDNPGLVVFGYLLWYAGWVSMVMVRIRAADDKYSEVAFFVMAVVFWVTGSAICVWAMTTATDEGE